MQDDRAVGFPDIGFSGSDARAFQTFPAQTAPALGSEPPSGAPPISGNVRP